MRAQSTMSESNSSSPAGCLASDVRATASLALLTLLTRAVPGDPRDKHSSNRSSSSTVCVVRSELIQATRCPCRAKLSTSDSLASPPHDELALFLPLSPDPLKRLPLHPPALLFCPYLSDSLACSQVLLCVPAVKRSISPDPARSRLVKVGRRRSPTIPPSEVLPSVAVSP